MPNLTSQQLAQLGERFLAFSQAVGNYRMENWTVLSKSQNQQIKELHRTLLNYADDLFTTSSKLVMVDIRSSLDIIDEVTGEISKTYHTLEKVQKAIAVAAAGITLGAAIFSKSPEAIGGAVGNLVKSWKAE